MKLLTATRERQEGHHISAGMGPDVLGEGRFTAPVAETLVGMVEIARLVPVGAVVGRRLDRPIRRSGPSEARER